MIDTNTLVDQFKSVYKESPKLISRAPGRVNLIGEHTDYNGGFVFPAAISFEMKIAASLRADKTIHMYSVNFEQSFSFSLNAELTKCDKPYTWVNYFVAVIAQFVERGFDIPGMNIALSGDVPLGAGLSSSAAYEVCVASMLNYFCKSQIDPAHIALLSQAAEHSKFVGVQCGIMDQFISALGKADHALMIDCHSLDYELVPFDSSKADIVIINSMKKRGLVDSEYNTRRAECELGLQEMRKLTGKNYETIRHIPYEDFLAMESKLSTRDVCKRLRHNITENMRVHDFGKALANGDFELAGKLLCESHASLRDDFEVSCPELDVITEIAADIYGTFGCRMTGAGFGGCAVALVKPEMTEEFQDVMFLEYKKRTKQQCITYVSKPCDGTNVTLLED